MRTMRQIENEAITKAKARAAELCGQEDNYFGITRNEIIAMQTNARLGEKFWEMFALLRDAEAYLKKITHTYPQVHADLLKRIEAL